MPTDEQERQEQFLATLLALALRAERAVALRIKPDFLASMRQVRRLVQRMAADGDFRQYEWRQLRRQVPDILAPAVAAMAVELLPELKDLAGPVQVFGQDYADLEPAPTEEDDDAAILATTLIAGVPLVKMLGPGGNMSQSLANFLDRIVTVGLLRGDTTAEIADDVLALTLINGKLTPRVKKGSFASKASTQIKNTIASSVWSAVNNNLFKSWKTVDNSQWVWNAVLDERLCPICSPLNGKIVPKPTSFVSTVFGVNQPPVHPNCRCAILPLRT